jgi:hypothetical protein
MASKESIPSKAERALKHAVRDLIKARRATNDTIVIWKNGKVVRVPARKVA